MKKEEGDCCDVEDCPGFLEYPKPVDCSCHINPPCHVCTERKLTCPHCGYELEVTE